MSDGPVASAGYVPIPRRALAAAVLVITNFMVILDLTVANVSIPHIAGSLGVSLDQGTWVITSYAVAEAISVPLTGWVVLRFGGVRVLLGVMTGFAFFSLLCGISLTLDMIILSRIGQGICGGLLMPLTQTLLLRIFPPEEHNKALLLFTTTILLAPAFGPNVGGFLSDNFSWHWIFLINIPIAAICVPLSYVLLRPAETQVQKQPIDLVGLALLVFWVGCMQIMLDIGRTHDWFEDPLIVLLAMGAVLGFIVFVVWELTEEHPIVDIRVFRYRGFSFAVFALSLCYGAYFASLVLIPQWLQTWMGYTATLAGFITACTAIAALSTSQLAGKAMNYADPRLLFSVAVFWLGCMALMRSHWTTGADMWSLMLPQILQGFAITFFILPLTSISLGAVRPDETASAAGLQNFVRTVTIAVATAVALSIVDNTSQAAHSELASKLQPDDTLATLTDSGMPYDIAIRTISNLVEREAMMIAVDHLFQLTIVAFLLSAAAIWLAPRGKSRRR